MEKKKKPKSLGGYLKTLRHEQGLTLRMAAKLTGMKVTNAHISKVERDLVMTPSPHVLFALSKAYKVSFKSVMKHAGYLINIK